ncbi:MAG: SulP family inorganic anion transporter [Agriterribacter sp.]
MSTRKGMFSNLKNDVLAGVVVFLIALPLCLAIAQASQAPLFSGIVSGVIGGIVIGILSKSHLSVSGPAAGLVAIVITAIATLGSFKVFLLAVLLAGAIQFALGLLKAGSFAAYFPNNVIQGMLAGIGLTIIIKQIPDATGGWGKINEPIGIKDADDGFNLKEILHSLSSWEYIEPMAIIIAVIGLFILFLWTTPALKRFQIIPAGLLVVVLGTLINIILGDRLPHLSLGESHKVTLPIPNNFSEFIAQFQLPDFSAFSNSKVWETALVIAAVASIETLLCVEAVDKMDPLKRITPGNRELLAQGTGNMLSGLTGGLPITSVIVRSSANVNAGAKTKLSAIVHGILLLGCVATIPTILNHIPKAALAAILIFTGYKLASPKVFKHMWKAGRTQFIPFLATAVAVFAMDLLKGVALGLIISIFYILRQNLKIPYFFNRTEFHEKEGNVIRIELAQELSFLNKAHIKQMLANLPPKHTVVLDASNTAYIDYDVLEEIKEFRDVISVENDIHAEFEGFKPEHGIENTRHETKDDFADYDEFMRHYLKASK